MKKIILFSIISVMSMFTYAAAQDFKNIAADEMKKMFDNKTHMALIDARTETEYAQGHIPKAVNIPPEKLGKIETLLPKSKNTLIIFYCRGIG